MDKRISKAANEFRKPLTCAQTVYAAFAEMDAQKSEWLKANSGGRAPEGICGALFAAKQLCPNDYSVEEEFSKRVGDTRCKEIKAKFKTPCEDCVRIAAEIVASRLK